MDKLKLTGQSLGYTFNYRCGRVCACNELHSKQKILVFKLKYGSNKFVYNANKNDHLTYFSSNVFLGICCNFLNNI